MKLSLKTAWILAFVGLVICLLLCGAPKARADVGLTFQGGTLGAGLNLTLPMWPQVQLRVGGNYFVYSFDRTYSSIDTHDKLHLGSGMGLLDWHPGGGGFRLSGGLLLNGNRIDVTGVPSGTVYDVNGTPYPASQVGTLSGDVKVNALAPYAGIGYGDALSAGSPWSVSVDLGAAYQGTPKLTYTADGPLASDPTFNANLNAEAAQARHDLNNFKYYPVVSLGLSYRF
jgi:hypothetical protein